MPAFSEKYPKPIVPPKHHIPKILKGQKALVTGANSGIGKAVAIALGEAGADVVIAVIVDRAPSASVEIETAKDVLYRAGEITANALEASELKEADVIIRPVVGDLHWMDFSRAGDLVKMGEAAARESLGKISSSLPLYRRIARFAGKFIKRGKKAM